MPSPLRQKLNEGFDHLEQLAQAGEHLLPVEPNMFDGIKKPLAVTLVGAGMMANVSVAGASEPRAKEVNSPAVLREADPQTNPGMHQAIITEDQWTYSHVGQNHGVPTQSVIDANRTDPHRLRIGDVVNVPTAQPVTAARAETRRSVTVQPNDNLGLISTLISRHNSVHNGTPMQVQRALIAENEITNPDLIHPRDVLILPGDINYHVTIADLPQPVNAPIVLPVSTSPEAPPAADTLAAAQTPAEAQPAPEAPAPAPAPQPTPEQPVPAPQPPARPSERVNIEAIEDVRGVDDELIERAVTHLMDKHQITPQAAAYLAGNFIAESNLNTRTASGDDGNAHGIGQWTGGRAEGMPSPDAPLEDHLDFAVMEMNRDRIAAANDVLETFRDPNASPGQIQEAIKDWVRYGAGNHRNQNGQEIFEDMSASRPASPSPEPAAAAPAPAVETPAPSEAPAAQTPAPIVPASTPAPEMTAAAAPAPEAPDVSPAEDKPVPVIPPQPPMSPAAANSGNNGNRGEGNGRSNDSGSGSNHGPRDAHGYVAMPENPDDYRFESFTPHEERYAHPETIEVAVKFADRFTSAHPDMIINYGDFNAVRGHASHKKGVDFDLDGSGGNKFIFDMTKSGYSADLTIEAGRMLIDTGRIELIFFNDPVVINALNEYARAQSLPGVVQEWPNHANHAHVRTTAPEGPSIG